MPNDEQDLEFTISADASSLTDTIQQAVNAGLSDVERLIAGFGEIGAGAKDQLGVLKEAFTESIAPIKQLIAMNEQLNKLQQKLSGETAEKLTADDKQWFSNWEANHRTVDKLNSDYEAKIRLLSEQTTKFIQQQAALKAKAQIDADKAFLKQFEDNRKTEEGLFAASKKREEQIQRQQLMLAGGGGGAAAVGGGALGGFLFDAGAIALRVAGIYSIFQALNSVKRATVGFIETGVETANSIRDVDLAIQQYVKDGTTAADAIKFLNQAEKETRNTSLELKQAFVDLFPKGQEAGFGARDVEQWIVNLSKISNLRQRSMEELEAGLRNVIGGRIVGSNPLLAALGITIEKIKEIRAAGGDVTQFVLDRMDKVAAAGAGMGDSLGSVFKKLKFDIMESFADGFNSARADAMDGMSQIKAAFNDPEFLQSIKNIGELVAQSIGKIGEAVTTIKEIVATAKTIKDAIPPWLVTFITTAQHPERATGVIYDKFAPPQSKQMANAVMNAPQDLSLLLAEEFPAVFGQLGSSSFRGRPGGTPSRFGDFGTKQFSDLYGGQADRNLSFGVPNAKEQAKLDKEAKTAANKALREQVEAQKNLNELTDKYTKSLGDSSLKLLEEQGLSKDIYTFRKAIFDAAEKNAESVKKINEDIKKGAVDRKGALNLAQQQLDVDNKIALVALATHKITSFYNQLPGGGYETVTESEIKKQLKAGKKDFNEIPFMLPSGALVDKETYDKDLKQRIEIAQKSADAFNADLEKFFRGPLADMFEGLAEGGGKGFVKAVQANFSKLITAGSQGLATKITKMVGGQAGVDAQGNLTINGETGDFSNKQKTGAAAEMALTAATIAIGAYANAKENPKGSLTQGAIGGAVAGSTYGPYGAAIGAIIGYGFAELGKKTAQKDYKYAIPNIDASGNVTLATPASPHHGWRGGMDKNTVTSQEAKDMVNSITETVEKFWGGFATLAVKVSADMPIFDAINGKFQENPSGHFMENFQNWVTHTLPDKLVGEFQAGLSTAYQHLGMSAEKFKAIWDKFGKLDPEKLLVILNLVADSLKVFQNWSKFSRDIGGDSQFKGTGFNMMVGEQSNIQQHQTYAQQFALADVEITKMATELTAMPKNTEAYFSMTKDFSDILVARMAQMKQLASEFASFLIQSGRTFDELRRTTTLATMGSTVTDSAGNKTFKPDLNAQQAYLQQYLQTIMDNLKKATNLDQLNYWQGQFFTTIGQMQGIAGQGGPDSAQAFNTWLLGANGKGGVIDLFQTAVNNQVAQWGIDLQAQNNKLFDGIQPVIDAFTGSMSTAGTSAINIGTDLGNLHDPIKRVGGDMGDLATAVEDAVTRINNVSGTSSSATSPNNKFTSSVVINRVMR